MDLRLLFRALWRFRFLVVLGVAFAAAVALLAYVRVEIQDGRPKLIPRQEEVWQSRVVFFVTQPGARYVRTDDADEATNFAELAVLYAALADSDEVYKIMSREGPVRGKLTAQALTDAQDRTLPLMAMVGVATTPDNAVSTVARGAEAFREFIQARQREASVAPRSRVELQLIRGVSSASLVEPRKKTLTIVAFMTVMMGVIGIVLMLENARPAARKEEGPPGSRSIAPSVLPEADADHVGDEALSRRSA